jgi:hypothetical protein
MLLRIFRGTSPGVILLIFLVAAGVWVNAFINPVVSSPFHYNTDPMPLYSLLMGLLGKSVIAGVALSFVLVILITFLLVNFNTTVFFINERTFLPSIIYILFSGIFPHCQVLNPVLPAALLLMIAIRRIIDAYRKNGTAFNFFDASLLISTGSLFYANLIWFGLLVIIGIAILRTGNVKEIFLAILGLCTPMVLTAGIYYAAGKDPGLLVSTARFNLFEEAGNFHFSKIAITGLIIITLCIIVSVGYLFSVMNSKKIKSRKTFSELIWTFIITVVLYFSLPSASVDLIFIAAIPLSYFLSHYFIFSKKKLIPEIFFTVFIIIVAVLQIWYRS